MDGYGMVSGTSLEFEMSIPLLFCVVCFFSQQVSLLNKKSMHFCGFFLATASIWDN